MNRENIKNILDKTNISVVDEIHILEYIEQLEQELKSLRGEDDE